MAPMPQRDDALWACGSATSPCAGKWRLLDGPRGIQVQPSALEQGKCQQPLTMRRRGSSCSMLLVTYVNAAQRPQPAVAVLARICIDSDLVNRTPAQPCNDSCRR